MPVTCGGQKRLSDSLNWSHPVAEPPLQPHTVLCLYLSSSSTQTLLKPKTKLQNIHSCVCIINMCVYKNIYMYMYAYANIIKYAY